MNLSLNITLTGIENRVQTTLEQHDSQKSTLEMGLKSPTDLSFKFRGFRAGSSCGEATWISKTNFGHEDGFGKSESRVGVQLIRP